MKGFILRHWGATVKLGAIALPLLLGLVYGNLPLRAQDGPVRAAVSDPTWQGAYWNNTDLTGAPTLQRSEPQLDFNWGNGAPDPTISADRFSARWTRYLYLEAGLYRFTATSDDGVRVFVNGQRILDGWSDHGEQTFAANVQLSTGHHLVRVEYYESSGLALLKLNWSQVGGQNPQPANWRAEFFNNRDLVGSPTLVREDREINFDWGNGAPGNDINADNFSARWTRSLDLPAGNYRFRLTVDDGARLWVNNALILDQWRDQVATTYTSDIYLPGGATPLRLEYFDGRGGAVLRLTWERTDQAPAPTARWRGEYFNNTDLSGGAALVREDENIDFIWGVGSPGNGVNADNFAVRWTRTVDFPAGIYRFRVRMDDGARLWVNNQLLIDQWRQQSETTYSAEYVSLGGALPLKLEYYDEGGGALIKLTWERTDPAPTPTPSPATGKKWRGEYFNNRDFSGVPVLIREDRTLDFIWGADSPAPGVVNNDNFAVRWTITLDFSGGKYRFSTETDDGVRFYIDNKLLIDQWKVMPRTRFNAETTLSKGSHILRMEYFDQSGTAVARLGWRKVTNLTTVGNIVTCVPPQPANYAWIKLYRLDGNGNWYSLGRGIGSTNASGYLKIDGLAVDVNRFGNRGEPYRVEQWINGKVARSVGNTSVGEPEFRVRAATDNQTPWQC